jgi:hypothetical protein
MTRPTANTSAKAKLQTQLEKKLDTRLIAYVAAASAAGVGLLAQSAEAKIVYTQANVDIVRNQTAVTIDFNNDGIADFSLFYGGETLGVRRNGNLPPEGAFGSGLNVYPAQTANQVWGIKSTKGWECAAALPNGVKVGPGAPFQNHYLPLWAASGSYTRGATEHCPWGEQHRGAFLGLKFVVNGETHYGWAHITVGSTTTVLNGYAYETVPNQPIDTGKTSGPVAALDLPILAGPQPATLGMLAQGSRGLAIWRRPEELSA